MAVLRIRVLLLLLAAAGTLAFGQEHDRPGLRERIEAILARPAAQRTHWGISVRNLETGTALYEHNANRLFLPASNVKLFSTALALARLGREYSFTTTVVADGAIDGEGVLQGSLRLLGGGDPNLSSRQLPYRNTTRRGPDPLAPMIRLARQVREAGITRVEGDVIGDDSRYVWQPYPRGWGHADTLRGYGSPISALAFNDSVIRVHVQPGGPGSPARLRTAPNLGLYELANGTRTVSGDHVSRALAMRWGGSPREVVLSGQIRSASRGRTFELAATDPALYAALALRQALLDLGIEVVGQARSRYRLPEQVPSLRTGRGSPRDGRVALATAISVDLGQIVQVVNKVSQNLHAEMLLREVALMTAGVGSQEAAVASLRTFLAEAGLVTGEHVLRDGSGLSRHNLVTPAATVKLLDFMWRSPHREAYIASLPVAGHDGTLDWRFRRSPARNRIRAKTGSMSHVYALSGYVDRGPEESYAFSILANNFGLSSSSTRYLMDSIAATLAATDP